MRKNNLLKILRPWPSDQTLLIKHLLVKQNVLTFLPRCKPLLAKPFLLVPSRKVLKFVKNIVQQFLLFKQLFVTWITKFWLLYLNLVSNTLCLKTLKNFGRSSKRCIGRPKFLIKNKCIKLKNFATFLPAS